MSARRSWDQAEAEFRPLGLRTQTINALRTQGIHTLRDLSKLTKREIERLHGMGKIGVARVEIYLRREGPTIAIHDRPKVVSVKFEPRVLTAIDAWGLEAGVDSRADAVRRLVDAALAAEGTAEKRK